MNGQGQVIATARLVRPAYRTPDTAEIPSYLETLEGELLLAQDENRQLKTRLSEAQAELDRVLPGLVTATGKPLARTKSPHWVAGHVRCGDRFPVDLAKREGVAAIIQRPLALRSGAVLDPVQKAVVRGGLSISFPDSSWLILSVLAERAGVWVAQRELIERVFPGRTASGVRSAIGRARQTLACVDAERDLETAMSTAAYGAGYGAGWRLLLAKEVPRPLQLASALRHIGDGWTLDQNSLWLTVADSRVHLTPQESRVLGTLADAGGSFVAAAQIGASAGISDDAVRTNLTRIRDKFRAAGADFGSVVEHSQGAGYRARMTQTSEVAS